MIQSTLASELAAVGSPIVIALGQANSAITHLQDLGALDPARCLVGLPHPSPASPFREKYFQAARTQLISQARRLDVGTAPPAKPHLTRLTPQKGAVPALRHVAAPHIVVPLTQGNLTYGHVYLRTHLSFFPADAIGAPNARDRTGTMLTLHLEGLTGPVRTDIAADKKIFRCRGAWREFFRLHHLQPGDQLVIERLSAYEYRVHCAR